MGHKGNNLDHNGKLVTIDEVTLIVNVNEKMHTHCNINFCIHECVACYVIQKEIGIISPHIHLWVCPKFYKYVWFKNTVLAQLDNSRKQWSKGNTGFKS